MPSKTSFAMFVRAAVLPMGYVHIYWIQSHKKRPFLSVYHEAEEFSLSVQGQGGADQINWTPHFLPHGLVAAGFRSRNPVRFGKKISNWRLPWDECSNNPVSGMLGITFGQGDYWLRYRKLNPLLLLPVEQQNILRYCQAVCMGKEWVFYKKVLKIR